MFTHACSVIILLLMHVCTGAFGKVYLGRLKLVNNADVKTRPIAIKTIKSKSLSLQTDCFTYIQ